MAFLILLVLTLACLPERWPQPGAWLVHPLLSVLLTGGVVLLQGVFAALIARRVQRMVRADLSLREGAMHFYTRARFYHTLSLMVGFGLSLFVLGWGWAVHSLWGSERGPWLGADLLLLLPYVAAQLLSWNCFYNAERAIHQSHLELFHLTLATEGTALDPVSDRPRFWSRRGYLAFHARQTLALVMLPVLLLVTEKEVRRLLPEEWLTVTSQGSILGIAGALTLFLAMPWILRLVLGLRPLPDGPLRHRLMALSQRLGFRCTDILLWNTRSGIANAMVAGVFPFLRYVLLTDRLIEELTPEEVEAVFGHEIGHVKHQHMLYYLVFMLASIAIMTQALTPFLEDLDGLWNWQNREDLAVLPMIAVLGAYIFFVFGFLSRRCERQADIFGCRAASCAQTAEERLLAVPRRVKSPELCPEGIQTFIGALEKVAILNGISREKPGFFQSWQHSTIARRVAFLEQMMADPQLEARFQRRVLLVKCGLLAILGVIFVVLVSTGSGNGAAW